jgi:serine/threonine protein kinase
LDVGSGDHSKEGSDRLKCCLIVLGKLYLGLRMTKEDKNKDKQPDHEELSPTASYDVPICGPSTRIGQFRIEREIGRGAMGIVYLAHDSKLNRQVAIKSLPAEVMVNPKARSRFSREARMLTSQNHPNIATIYDELEEAEGIGYLITP